MRAEGSSPRVTVALECEPQEIAPFNGWPDLCGRARAARVKEHVQHVGRAWHIVSARSCGLGAWSPLPSQAGIAERIASVNLKVRILNVGT